MSCKSFIRHLATHNPGHLLGLQVEVADEPGGRPLLEPMLSRLLCKYSWCRMYAI